ncbi:hypothetical protein EDI29_17750 [Pectobacterium polonicum]|nr:hypothetical protein EDI29_17750 [Pectobacterium polonicum]
MIFPLFYISFVLMASQKYPPTHTHTHTHTHRQWLNQPYGRLAIFASTTTPIIRQFPLIVISGY